MPRPLNEQVVVITGASSGIGRASASLFGAHGARVVLAARDEAALGTAANEVDRAGGSAFVVPTDVAAFDQVVRLADSAVEKFGRIDTWVNNAGVTVGGTVDETDVEELERLVQVNLLGQIYGVKAALPHMKRQGQGAFINVGSVAGARAMPLQTVYSATKHGVRGFTEGLRLELQRLPGEFHVTYIAPTAINTPLFVQARSKMPTKLEPPDPVYEPEIVAESIVFAAEHPRRDVFVGGGAKLFEVFERISPSFTDWLLTRNDKIFRDQISDRPAGETDNLFEPPVAGRSVHGPHGAKAHSTSLYTRIFEWHPFLKPAALGLATLGTVALLRKKQNSR